MILIPWWVRNYRLFNEFIPLTYGMGDPMLLGTYQGRGYPLDEELDYSEYWNNESDEIKKQLTDNDGIYNGKKQWAFFRDEENRAKFRMKKWLEKSPRSFLFSYFVAKPFIMVYGSFYWDEIFGINIHTILACRAVDIIVCAICLALSCFKRNRLKEIIFIGMAYLYQVALYSYSFAFSRYGQVLIFHRYIIIGWMLYEFYCIIKRKKEGEILDGQSCSSNTMLQ